MKRSLGLPETSSVQYLIINEEQSEQRLDNFLYKLFSEKIPRAFIFSLIRTGQVRVNSGRVKPGYYLHIEDKLRIPPIKFNINVTDNNKLLSVTKTNNKFLDFWAKKIKNNIIFENDNLLIINKPAKLAVHGGSKVTIGLIEVLRHLRPEAHFLELVHRLDQDTSGCLMVAKKRSYLKKLHVLLREQKINKIYSAVVYGAFPKLKVVDAPLKKIIKSSKEHFVKVDPNGGNARTEFKLDKIFKLNNQCYSLITAKPATGKTHQIRVHLAHIGFPIVNDDKYGNRRYNVKASDGWPDRMFLHAKTLKFLCPKTKEVIYITANYDQDLLNFLAKLEQSSG